MHSRRPTPHDSSEARHGSKVVFDLHRVQFVEADQVVAIDNKLHGRTVGIVRNGIVIAVLDELMDGKIRHEPCYPCTSSRAGSRKGASSRAAAGVRENVEATVCCDEPENQHLAW